MADIIVDPSQVNQGVLDMIKDVTPQAPIEPPVAVAPVVAPAVTPPVVPPVTSPAPELTNPLAPGVTPAPAADIIPPNTDEVKRQTLKVIFGEDVDSEEKAKEILDSYKNQPPLESPFANDYIKGLNEYIKNGGSQDIYSRVMSLDLEKMTPFDAQKTLMLWENPELKEEDVALALNDKYRQTEDDSDADKRVGAVHMTTDGRAAKLRLAELQKVNSVPEPVRIAQNQERLESERIAKWAPQTSTLVDGVKELEVSLGENTAFKFANISNETRQQALADVQSAIKYSGIPYTPENIAELQRVAKERMIVRELPNILKAIKNQAETDTEAKIRAEYVNASPVVTGDTPPPAHQTEQDRLFKLQMERLG